ncbi:MAG: peptidoglycan-binding protein [Eubacteriales bacterium]|nr:peptidoglycan-binding protein [Eubacteriales bacterium]
MTRYRLAALAAALFLACAVPWACAETDTATGETASIAGEAANSAEETASIAGEAASGAETIIDTGESPAFVSELLSVAVGELGYTEGSNNYTKYGVWSGDPNAAWCAEFVCWCVDQTDQRYGEQLLNNVYPNYGGQNTGKDWFTARGRFVYRKGNCPDWGYQWLKGSDHLLRKNEYIPHPGDLVFFSYNEAGDTEHVALVEYCAYDADGSVIIHVIEGNNPSRVQRNSYPLNNSQVLGFGTCEDVVDTTMRFGCSGDKVLLLQQRLTELGYLTAINQTGAYGSHTKAAVCEYQQAMGCGQSVNGIADRETQQAIEAEILQNEFNSPDTWLVEE